jgi:polysaccharide export outer membrane protein
MNRHAVVVFALVLASASGGAAQSAPHPASPQAGAGSAVSAAGAVTPSPDYVIGPEDLLSIVFWRDKDMSADVAVRPDGKISLPLLNDVQASGLTPLQLRDRVTEDAKRFVEDPNVSVVVKQINSRKVFVSGEVMKPGPYPLSGPATVLQILATAGGLKEYADDKHILIMRVEGGLTKLYSFNYRDVANRRNLKQNIDLRPGDTIVVP